MKWVTDQWILNLYVTLTLFALVLDANVSTFSVNAVCYKENLFSLIYFWMNDDHDTVGLGWYLHFTVNRVTSALNMAQFKGSSLDNNINELNLIMSIKLKTFPY